jgi:PAS domain S-box-containing protein
MKVLLNRLEAGLRPLSSLTVTAIALCWVLAMGVADYYTPGSMSFVLFYMLAVVLAGWGAGKWQACLISCAALVTMVTVQLGLHRAVPQPFWIAVWNQTTRFLVFSIAGWLAAELRSLTRSLEERVERQTAQWKKEAEAHQATASRLSESLERFEQVINNIREVFWLTNVPKTEIVYISPGYEHIWGRKSDALYREPRSWLQAVHPADRGTVEQQVRTEQAKGSYDVEYRIIRPDGSERWIRDRAFPVRNAQGEVYRIAGVADDITERKQTQQTLQMQAAILENMAEGVVVTDAQGLIVQMNPAAERIWGYGRDEVLGKPASMFSALPELEAAAVLRKVLEALEATGTWRGTFSNRCKDGAIITCEAQISRLEIGGRVLMVAVEQDITERLRTQERLQLQALVLDSMAEAVLMVDEKGTIMLTNPAADATLGYGRGELPGRPLHAVLNYDSEAYCRGLEKSIAQVKFQGSAGRDYRARRKDGTIIEVETRSSPVVIDGHLFIVVVGQDITQRTEAERALARNEELYRTLFELSPDGILLEDIRGNILDANQALCRYFGCSREELVGQNVSRLVPLEAQEEVEAHLAELRAGKELRHEVWNVRKDGQPCLMWLNEKPLALPDGQQGIIVVARDVTETRRTELLKEVFLSLGAKLSAARSPVEAAQAIYASTGRLWKSDAGVLDFWLQDSNQIETVLAWDLVDGQRREVELDSPVGPPTSRTLRILEEGELILRQPGDLPEPDFIPFGDVRRPSASIMGVPMRAENQTVGVLSVQSYARNAFTRADLQTLQALADYCAGALGRLRAEAKLHESEQTYRALVETTGTGYVILDKEGRVLDANAEYVRLSGHGALDEILGRSVVEWTAPQDRQRNAMAVEECLKTGAVRNLELTYAGPTGLLTPIEINRTVVQTKQGQVILALCWNISARKRTEAAREALLSLGSKLNAARSPVEAARAIYASADLLWKWDSATLYVYSPETGRMQSVLDYDLLDGQRREVSPNDPSTPITPRMRRVMEEGPLLILREPPYIPREDSVMIGDVTRPSASIMQVPLRQEGQAFGVMSIQSYTPNAYTHQDLQTLQALADYCGGALERIGAEEALREAHARLEQRVRERTAELQSANIALRESGARLRLALDASNAGAWSWDVGSNQSEWDDRYHEHYGFDTHAPRSFEAWISRVHAEDRKRLLARIQALLEPGAGDAWNEEFRALHPKKGERWMAALGRVERDQAGRAIRLAGINLDITERKLVAQALREAHDMLEQRVHERTAELRAANAALGESEERYRSLVNNLNVGVYRNTPEPGGRFIQANPALARIHGYESVEEFEKASVAGFYQDPRERKKFLADLLREGTVRNYEVRLKKKDGTPIYGSVSASAHRGANGEVDWIDGMLEDVTHRKEAERQLAEALEFNRQVVSASTVGIGVYKASGRCVLVNDALAQITGGTAEQLLQQDFRRLKSWHDDGLLAKALAALDTRQPQELECQSRTTFGKDLAVSALFSSFVNQGELHLLFMLTDQTTAARAIAALRASEERYRTLAESSPDAIFILDREIRLEYVNTTTAALWRGTPPDLIGLPQSALFPPEIARRLEETVREVFATGKPVCRDEPLAYPTGDQWIEIRLAPLYDAQGSVASVMGISKDITDRKRTERQLTEALELNQKMLAAATMGMAAYKASGECIFANEALARSVGGSVSEVLQGNFRHLADWERSGLLDLAEKALSQGEASSGEVFTVTRFGKEVWLDCHAARFVSNGQPHLLLMALDISQRKLAERLQKALMDNIPDPAWLKDAEGRFLACNQALAAFYGQPVEAVLGKTVFDVVPHEAGRMTREDKKVMRTLRSVVGEARVSDARGNMRWLESIKSPLCNARDEVIGTVGIARDVTERKQAEFLLQAQRDLGVSLSLTSDMAVALKHLLNVTIQTGAVDSGGVYLLNGITGGMDVVVHHGLSAGFIKAVSHWAADSPQMRLMQRGKPFFGTYQEMPVPIDQARLSEGLKGVAFIPISQERRAIGALVLSSHATWEIPRQTQLVIEALATQAAGAIARIRAEIERHRLERQLLEITDREQARIGQDIHDGLCQHLVSLAFDANSLARELSSQRGAQAPTARRMAELADQAITETRQLARGLFPVRLDSEGLPSALEELAKTTRDRFKTHCRFRSKGAVTIPNSTIATHLYRIAQEAVANAVKHSQARVISIDLTAGADNLWLKVEDDGKGLRPKTSQGEAGMGLHIMDYRARSIGGTLRVTSRPRGGTQVFCCVPRPLR